MNINHIYDLCDRYEYDAAIRECDAVLKTYPDYHVVAALKALCLNRSDMRDQSLVIVNRLMSIINSRSEPLTIRVTEMCINELRRPDLAVCLFEKLNKTPESLSFLFSAYVKVANIKKQLQTSVSLFNITKNTRFQFWRLASIITEANQLILQKKFDIAFKISIPLAEKLAMNLEDEGFLDTEEKCILRLQIFDLLAKMASVQRESSLLDLGSLNLPNPKTYHERAIEFLNNESYASVMKDLIERKILLLEHAFLAGNVPLFMQTFDFLIQNDPDDWIIVDKLIAISFDKMLVPVNQVYSRIYKLYKEESESANASDRVLRRGPFMYMLDILSRLNMDPTLFGLLSLAEAEAEAEVGPDCFMSRDQTNNLMPQAKVSTLFTNILLEFYRLFSSKYSCAKDLGRFLDTMDINSKILFFETASPVFFSLLDANCPNNSIISTRNDLISFCNMAQCMRRMNLVYDPSAASLAHTSQRTHEEIKSAKAFAINYFLSQYIGTVDALCSASLETEVKDADPLVTLAVEYLIELFIETNESQYHYLYTALAALEYALEKSKSNSTFKLWHIRISTFLGYVGLSYEIFDQMRIKSVQTDSVAFLLATNMYLADPSSTYCQSVLEKHFRFYPSAISDTANCISSAYTQESYSQISELESFRLNLRFSAHRRLTSYAYTLQKMINIKSLGQLETIVGTSLKESLIEYDSVDSDAVFLAANGPKSLQELTALETFAPLYKLNYAYDLYGSFSLSADSPYSFKTDAREHYAELLSVYTKLREQICAIALLVTTSSSDFALKIDPFDAFCQLCEKLTSLASTSATKALQKPGFLPDVSYILSITCYGPLIALLKEPVHLCSKLFQHVYAIKTTATNAPSTIDAKMVSLIYTSLTETILKFSVALSAKYNFVSGHSSPFRMVAYDLELISIISVLLSKLKRAVEHVEEVSFLPLVNKLLETIKDLYDTFVARLTEINRETGKLICGSQANSDYCILLPGPIQDSVPLLLQKINTCNNKQLSTITEKSATALKEI